MSYDREHTAINKCAFCCSVSMEVIADFGEVALAGAFLNRGDEVGEKKYPMRVAFCTDCFGVQVIDHIDYNVLFDNYFYFSSVISTLRDHFSAYADEMKERFLKDTSTVLEFGCNDGVLLKPLADLGVENLIGVDPAKNVISSVNDSRITFINNIFSSSVASSITSEHGYCDLIMANNVFAHISDINDVTNAIRISLKSDGVFVFEVHYLGKVIDELQYDMIYHEHLYYYSLIALQNHFDRHSMRIFDVKEIENHAGSIRCFACLSASSKWSVSSNVTKLRQVELESNFHKLSSYREFWSRLLVHRQTLRKELSDLVAAGNIVAGYGASGRANTVIQFCGLDKTHMSYMIDDGPAKHYKLTPGSHFEIFPSSIMYAESGKRPDYVLVFAWSFFNEIRSKHHEFESSGGIFLLPLPEFKMCRTKEG